MRLLFLSLCSFVVFNSCNSSSNETSGSANDNQEITETPLPKGKLIIDDFTASVTNNDDGSASINGINGADNNQAPVIKPEDDVTRLKKRYKNLLVFHADDTMKIKKAYIATLILGKDQVLGDMKEEVLESSNAADDAVKQDTSIEIGGTMKARLLDMSGATNKGFDIELIGDESSEQKISDRRKKLMWQWKLTPLTPGQQNLTLSITVTEKDGNKVNLPVRSIPVVIFAEEESTMNKMVSFIEKNYQWLLATLLIPLFMGWFNARMRHRFDRKMIAERELREKQNMQNSQQHPPNTTANTTDEQKPAGNPPSV